MIRDAAVALIKQQMAFRRTLDDEIVTNMQLAQTMLEAGPTKPWFLISEVSTVLTTANEERVPVPDGFLQEVDEEGLCYVPTDGTDPVQLVKADIDELKETFRDEVPGIPQAYALVGNYFRLRPIPDAAYSIAMLYYEQDDVLSANVENGWLKYVPYLLMGTTLKQIAGGPVRDVKAEQVADQWISAGAKLLYSQNEARAHANREYQIGGPHW